MIRLLAFDLDGTLVQTERLKAESYARAAHELDASIDEADVIEAYKAIVGQSREEVATALLEQFGLEAEAEGQTEAGEPWQGYVEVRLRYYHDMIADEALVRAHRWPHTTALLRHARSYACKVALATTSERDVAERVLRALDLRDVFDATVTADDVAKTKPDSEAYERVLDTLDLAPAQGLAIEDSPAGIRAAKAAGLYCIAVTTDFTRARVHEAATDSDLIDPAWIVDDPARLPGTVRTLLEQVNGAATD